MRIPVQVEIENSDSCFSVRSMSAATLVEAGFQSTGSGQLMTQGTIMLPGTLEEDQVEAVENIPGVVNVWCSKTVGIY